MKKVNEQINIFHLILFCLISILIFASPLLAYVAYADSGEASEKLNRTSDTSVVIVNTELNEESQSDANGDVTISEGQVQEDASSGNLIQTGDGVFYIIVLLTGVLCFLILYLIYKEKFSEKSFENFKRNKE